MDEEEIEEKREEEQELLEDMKEDDAGSYGLPEVEKNYEKFKFLTDVKESQDTVRTTFVTREELGRPLFSLRFYINLEKMARLKAYNLVADYLHHKAITTTDTGLSSEGFLMNLAVKKTTEKLKRKQQREVQNLNG